MTDKQPIDQIANNNNINVINATTIPVTVVQKMSAAELKKQANQKKKEKMTAILRTPGEVMASNRASPHDLEESQKIHNIMYSVYQCLYSDQHNQQRQEVVGRLEKIIKQWSYNCAMQKQLPEEVAQKIEAKLFTFGSYRLQSDMIGGDIDTVCIMPKYFKRDKEFFEDLFLLLKNNPQVSSIQAIKDAQVPILKMTFENIQIDILCCELDTETIEDSINLLDNNMMAALDDKSLKSINGFRVAEKILESVRNPPKQNQLLKQDASQKQEQNSSDNGLQNFRSTLRCIKLWADNKGIYKNMMGYLGGVSWAILTAKICQMYPNLATNGLLEKFFHNYSRWDWGQIPVRIVNVEDEPNQHPKNLGNWKEEWKKTVRQPSLMDIITPAFPCMNSSHNINESSLEIIKDFLKEGYQCILDIKRGRKQWMNLFRPFNFFKAYPHFIEVDIAATERSRFESWKGLVSANLRKLVINLQTAPAMAQFDPTSAYTDYYDKRLFDYFKLHLYQNGYPLTNDLAYPFKESYYVGLKLLHQDAIDQQQPFDFITPVTEFLKFFAEKKNEQEDIFIFQTAQHQIEREVIQKFNVDFKMHLLDMAVEGQIPSDQSIQQNTNTIANTNDLSSTTIPIDVIKKEYQLFQTSHQTKDVEQDESQIKKTMNVNCKPYKESASNENDLIKNENELVKKVKTEGEDINGNIVSVQIQVLQTQTQKEEASINVNGIPVEEAKNSPKIGLKKSQKLEKSLNKSQNQQLQAQKEIIKQDNEAIQIQGYDEKSDKSNAGSIGEQDNNILDDILFKD